MSKFFLTLPAVFLTFVSFVTADTPSRIKVPTSFSFNQSPDDQSIISLINKVAVDMEHAANPDTVFEDNANSKLNAKTTVETTAKKTSFLQNPWPHYLVKDSLFISQPLKGDEQVRVNVIEREPLFGKATNVAIASQSGYLREKFDADLLKLRSSFLRYHDVLTRNNAAPIEVINFAIESGVPSVVESRRHAEQTQGDAARTANLARRRIAAQNAMDSLEATEQRAALGVDGMLG